MRTLLPLLALMVLLSGCDHIGPGYINKRASAVTIVEHGGSDRRFTLAPSQQDPPGFGPEPRSIDIIGADPRHSEHYRLADIPRNFSAAAFRYIVINDTGVAFVSKETIPADHSH